MSFAHREHEASAKIGAPHYLAVWVALVVLAGGSYLFARVHSRSRGAAGRDGGGRGEGGAGDARLHAPVGARGASRLAMGVAFGFIALLMSLTLADVVTRLPVANPPQSQQARSFLEEQPPLPWSGEQNLLPARQPHYEAP
jgi:hypothetical protein